ncbi:MAG: hypothetical protein ACRDP6_37795, partial [Actinoallomurus sp.]
RGLAGGTVLLAVVGSLDSAMVRSALSLTWGFQPLILGSAARSRCWNGRSSVRPFAARERRNELPARRPVLPGADSGGLVRVCRAGFEGRGADRAVEVALG